LKVLLVSPSSEAEAKSSKFSRIPQLALPILSGLTPEKHDVHIVEEELEEVDLDASCDLVGISCMTSNAPRGYSLAKQFKKRGKKVVMGGVHPSILPNEALEYADSVVVGEAEGVWGQVVEDAENGELKPVYHSPSPPLDFHVPGKFNGVKKKAFGVIPLMTTRGCPYDCEFCCVNNVFGNKIRHVPVGNVVKDITESGGKLFLFLDDNIIGNPNYARELFTAIKPLGIRWVGQASISFVKNESLMKLAAESGCIGLFFGLESVARTQLEKMRKSICEIHKIEEAIRKVRDHGIEFHASMIFGFDDDTESIFEDTLDFLNKNKIYSVSLNTLTPYPGTRLYDRLKQQGRLLTEDWRHYDHKTVVFTPMHMTPSRLQEGRMWVFKEFTRLFSILKKAPFHLDHPLFFAGLSIGRRKACREDLRRYSSLASHRFPQATYAGKSQTGISSLTEISAEIVKPAPKSIYQEKK
jgi:radical SAM superfamily enzyme YgiQ (UPF0313 family)